VVGGRAVWGGRSSAPQAQMTSPGGEGRI